MQREVIELPEAVVEVEIHDAFLFIRERGRLRSLADLQRYTRRLETLIARSGTRRAVIDAREEQDDASDEVRAEMWAWLTDPDHGFEMVAFVLESEMAVARVNMTSLARHADVRAFDSVFDAQRWILKGKRRSTAGSMQNLRSSAPPPPSRPPRPEGTYHVSGGREERISTRPIDARPRTRSSSVPLADPRRSTLPPTERRSDVRPLLEEDGARRDGEEGGEGSRGAG